MAPPNDVQQTQRLSERQQESLEQPEAPPKAEISPDAKTVDNSVNNNGNITVKQNNHPIAWRQQNPHTSRQKSKSLHR